MTKSKPETTHQKVSALILTKNEEKKITRCLESLVWADEILVIDAQSTDSTRALCLEKGKPWSDQLRLLERPWSGFKDQRNFSLHEARNDWVLIIDADEACSPELAAKIRTLLNSPAGPPARAFKVRRIEYFLGKPIHFGIWNPSYQDRFFHRAGVRYINDIHEYPIFPTPPHEIHEPLFHSPDFSSERFLEKMNTYTSIEAKDRVTQGQRTNAFKLIAAFPAMFFKNYFYYGAYKDGTHGLVISLLEGVSRVVRHIKIWQMTR
ncbi:glycosyltransferase family 2 protein [Bdellovibrionota bacterium FG-2]